MLKGIKEEWLKGLMDFVGQEGIEYVHISPFPNYRGRWLCHACTATIDDTNELPISQETIPHFSSCVYAWVTKERERARQEKT